MWIKTLFVGVVALITNNSYFHYENISKRTEWRNSNIEGILGKSGFGTDIKNKQSSECE